MRCFVASITLVSMALMGNRLPVQGESKHDPKADGEFLIKAVTSGVAEVRLSEYAARHG